MAVGCRPFVIGLLLSIGWPGGCEGDPPAPKPEVQSFAGLTMGTAYTVRYHAASCDLGPPGLKGEVDDRLAEINRRMSTYDPDSELSRFNASESTDWFAVSEETARVVAFALKIAKESGGAFDPTVGPVVNLWGFGPDGRRREPPSEKQLSEAWGKVGYLKVEVRLDPPALRKNQPDVYLDLSAVAKGYASDALGELLETHSVEAYMVEIGGEVATKGVKPGGEPWRIGIEEPEVTKRAYKRVVELSGDALATSGDYRNFFVAGGVRYSHTINPATGKPVQHGLATATVRAPTCMEADALATALLVLGPDRGYDWAEERGIAAMLVERTGEEYRELTTNNWNRNSAASTEAIFPMMQVFLITAAFFVIALVGMAIGAIVSNRRIKGSCGGLANFKDSAGNSICEACTNPSPDCRGEPLQEEASADNS